MFSSLRFRLWLSYTFLVATALGVVAIILFINLIRNPFLYRQTIEKLKAVQSVLTDHEVTLPSQPISDSVQNASRIYNVRILIYSQDKQLILDTYSDREVALTFPETRLILRSITPFVRDVRGALWLYSIGKLSDQTYLIVASPRPRLSIFKVFTDDFLPLILQGGLIALLLSLLLAFLFARWIADPLQKVVFAARSMPSEQARPIDVRGPLEVQELTRAFNSMIARTLASQKSQREFAANVSHELKTPLTSVQGFAQALLDGTADSFDARQKAAQVIYDESGRMHRLVLDLLDLARLDAGTADITMSSVNISGLLNSVAEKFTPQLQKAGINIKLDIDKKAPSISADGDRLAQVFTNLVDNALKFTPHGGLITIHNSVVDKNMLISVSDSGVGIPAQMQAQIFDRFYQADPARKGGEKHGAGLGLAIVQEIVKAHGGRITVRSKLGEGSSFDVYLPLTGKSATTIYRRK